jgi:hemerythrin-like domain-containing protein
VSPPEDLMREHGVLKRLLLVYDEYHEKLEEDYLFPRFEKANRLTDLTSVLRTQHQAGRQLTERILQAATADSLKSATSAGPVIIAMQQFIRMYEPHEAREDTVLFPALRTIVSKHEFDALGEDFEKKEHQLFGDDGFEKMVEQVAGIERRLAIYDLASFTPA